MFNNKKILITGGTGSWGNELTKQLFEKYSPNQIIIYSRGELKQVDMKRDFKNNPKLKFIIGDVRDYERLKEATENVDYIFHLAALKHVPVCEENPWEAVKTNIIAVQNIINAAISNSVKKVIDVSTDKAVDPLNLYGTTKAIGEKLIIAANNLTDKTSFVCIRGGNVLGTTGSVIPLFKKQIMNINKITITDENMTRFFLNLNHTISLLFEASIKSVGGEIFVLNMPSMRMKNLADVMIKELGDKKTKKEIIGKRPGEKVHEVLVSRHESERTYKVGNYFMILPMIKVNNIEKNYDIKKLQKVDFEEFNSKNAIKLNHKEIKEMLDLENWLKKEKINKENIKYEDKKDLLNFFKNEGWIK